MQTKQHKASNFSEQTNQSKPSCFEIGNIFIWRFGILNVRACACDFVVSIGAASTNKADEVGGDLTFTNHWCCCCDLLSIQKRWHYVSIRQMNERTCSLVPYFWGGRRIWNVLAPNVCAFIFASTCTWQYAKTKKKTKKHNNLIRDNFKSQMLISNKIHSCLLLSLIHRRSTFLHRF